MRREARDAMLPFLTEVYANPSSVHALGSAARCAVEDARGRVATLIGARPSEVVFTSGGSEANNLAVQGAVNAAGPGAIVTTAIEHASVRDAVAYLARTGHPVEEVAVDRLGRVDVDALPAPIVPCDARDKASRPWPRDAPPKALETRPGSPGPPGLEGA